MSLKYFLSRAPVAIWSADQNHLGNFVEGFRRNISVRILKIWASGLGGDEV